MCVCVGMRPTDRPTDCGCCLVQHQCSKCIVCAPVFCSSIGTRTLKLSLCVGSKSRLVCVAFVYVQCPLHCIRDKAAAVANFNGQNKVEIINWYPSICTLLQTKPTDSSTVECHNRQSKDDDDDDDDEDGEIEMRTRSKLWPA